MIHHGAVIGKPLVLFKGLKSSIEAMSLGERYIGAEAYGWTTSAEVDGQPGWYDGTTWHWGAGAGPGAGVESVSGAGVDNTDPANPVISYPTPGDIGAATAAQGALADTAIQASDLGSAAYEESSVFQPASTPLSEIAAMTPSDDDVIQRKAGSWTSRTLAQLFSDFISGLFVREKLTANRTYYVRTDGSNSNNGLTNSSGGAFLTIAKAFTVCQSLDFAGYTVTIQIGAGTFSENLTLENVHGAANLVGTLTELETITSATITAGSAGTRGTITKTGAFTGDSYAGKLAYFVTDGEYRVIRSHDNNTATVVGTCPSSTTQNVKIYGWGTTIAGSSGAALKINSQNSVSITDIQFTSSNAAGGVVPKSCLNLNFTRCNFDCILYVYYCNDGGLAYCVLDYTSTYMLRLTSSKYFNLYGSWVNTNGTACVDCNSHSHILVYYGSDIGGSTPTYGFLVQMLSSAQFINASGTGYARIASCATGVRAINGGQVIGTTNNQYASNTTNESADATTFAYID